MWMSLGAVVLPSTAVIHDAQHSDSRIELKLVSSLRFQACAILFVMLSMNPMPEELA